MWRWKQLDTWRLWGSAITGDCGGVVSTAEFGFPASGWRGTDATANYAAPIRGQVGMDRVYVRMPAHSMNVDEFFRALKADKHLRTNGPLLDFSLGGAGIGGDVNLDGPEDAVTFRAKMQS